MSVAPLTVKENIRFDEALQLTQSFLTLLQEDGITPSQVTEFVSELVKTENGARGFFVIYLTAENPICDHTHPEIIQGLATSPDIAAELLVKNIAMSTAQGIFHRRNEDLSKAESSIVVARRSAEIVRQLNSPHLRQLFQQLLTTIHTGTGEYSDFLNRWGYDEEQRATIANVISELSL